ncbi:MAG: hypothetical protein RI963_2186 [Planctomycetota bacterium]
MSEYEYHFIEYEYEYDFFEYDFFEYDFFEYEYGGCKGRFEGSQSSQYQNDSSVAIGEIN